MNRNIVIEGFLLIVILSMLSCEKDIDYPRKFIFHSYSPGSIKLCTNSGEVSDPDKINRFISGSDDYFWINMDSLDSERWDMEIILWSETRAQMMSPDTTIDFNLKRQNGILYFEYTDTLVSGGNLTDPVFKFHPLYMVNLIPHTGITRIAYIPCIYAVESEKEIQFPVVSYIENIYYDTGSLMTGRGMANYNNEFNPDYLNSLSRMPLTDTLAYQNNYVVFKQSVD